MATSTEAFAGEFREFTRRNPRPDAGEDTGVAGTDPRTLERLLAR